MKVRNQYFEILDRLNGKGILKKIEKCGRVCYKSENKISDGTAEKFVGNIIKRGHESVLEHVSFSVRFVTDRAIGLELVRHRLASFSQESQRYVAYDGDIEFIRQVDMNTVSEAAWHDCMEVSEAAYKALRKTMKLSPQLARSVLPNSTKTEIIVTANLREWRHILKLRTSKAAHPQMRALMIPLLNKLKKLIPIVFDDIEVEK